MTMKNSIIFFLLLNSSVLLSVSGSWLARPLSVPTSRRENLLLSSTIALRGGEEDDERYSRQVYTLGAEAHGLIRSSTVYIDGPPTSGLVYECAKNLALSGIRRLVIVTSDESLDKRYHNQDMDDLGVCYQRAARAEVNRNDIPSDELLVDYLRRLNPSILVSKCTRNEITPALESSRGVVLCLDRPYPTQLLLDKMAREASLAFVAVETSGVFGRVFCDFGPSFEVTDVDGERPFVTPLDRIEMSDDDTITVYCVEGEKHDVSKGDKIRFLLQGGDSEPLDYTVKGILSPFRLTVEIPSTKIDDVSRFVEHINENAAAFTRVKEPQHLSFYPIESILDTNEPSLFTPCDLEKAFDNTRRKTTMTCLRTLSDFVQKWDRFPSDESDKELFNRMVLDYCASDEEEKVLHHINNFLLGCEAKFAPLQAVFGAIGAQEALKAVTGLYHPIKQVLLYDCDEILPEFLSVPSKEGESESDKGLRHIFGDKFVDDLQSQKVFVVGAGAIGCEILKNLATLGIATKGKGTITLTDMDTIEKSNLSRQLLFRDSDIGKFKSTAAHEAVLRFNPSLKIISHCSRVGGSDQSPFDDDFWATKVDIVLNALDNVEARLYIDGKCIANSKALVDAGTMGAKGNVQVVVPFKSESYSSSADPPEPSIPICTLKNFPYLIAHTIQWARDMFDGLFRLRPSKTNDFFEVMKASNLDVAIKKLMDDSGKEAALVSSQELHEDIQAMELIEKEDLRKAALKWAVALSKKLFQESVETILRQHPLDSLDEDGLPFWSGTRRPPKFLSYGEIDEVEANDQVLINENLIEFVRNAARLRMENLVQDTTLPDLRNFSEEEAIHALSKNENIPDSRESSNMVRDEHVEVLIKRNLNGSKGVSKRLTSIEFEKDDDSNGHVAFITAASNLRAISYGIPPVDAMETRRVAGNIVPAMITTTAFISALSCIEMIKVVQKRELRSYRNAFINLALPFFAFTRPLPAERVSGLRGRDYTLWDRLIIKEGSKAAEKGGIKIKSLLRKIKEKSCDDPESISIVSVSYGPYLLYANFLHEDDSILQKKSLWTILGDAINESDELELDDRDDERNSSVDGMDADQIAHARFVDLTVVVEDLETGEEIELPPVRVQKYRQD